MTAAKNLPDKKKAQNPSKAELAKAEYFELEILKLAVEEYKKDNFLKSAMMAWSYIEEYFLPNRIEFIAKNQKLKFKSDYLDSLSTVHLIRYYYLISYDQELFELLEVARKLRNDLVHKTYKSGTIKEIENNAKATAKYILYTLVKPTFDRLEGKIIAPSLMLYSNGWNDMRRETIKNLGLRMDELTEELTDLNSEN